MSPRSSRARAGFTLIELMIALVTGGLVISTMYAVSSASARHFQVQHQVANMQSSLRFAYMQLKRDLTRAGYQATPLESLNVCTPSGLSGNILFGGMGGWIAGISSFRNDLQPNIVDPTLNNGGMGFSHDSIAMVGNYTTSNEYPIQQDVSASTIQLDINVTSTWHSLQTDFGWNPTTQFQQPLVDGGLIAAAFPQGGLIRIQTTGRVRHFATLTSPAVIAGNTVMLTFTPPLPPECQSMVKQGWVAPLNIIRYGAVMSAAGTPESDRITGGVAQLLRTEVQPDNKVLAFGATVPTVVLDYLASFNLSFTMNAPTCGLGITDCYGAAIGVPTNNEAVVNANPELVRAVTVELAVRAPSIDTGAVWPPPGTPTPQLMVMQLDRAAQNRGARVRFLRSEIFLPNIAYEGY